MNSKLTSLGEGYTDAKLRMRFVSAVERGAGDLYAVAMQQYHGAQIHGPEFTLDQLRALLARVYATDVANCTANHALKGLATADRCTHCGKTGHWVSNCWAKNPTKAPAPSRNPDGRRSGRKRLCWECGKGHIAAECPMKNRSSPNTMIAANALECKDKEITFIDSACSLHLVESLDVLRNVHKLETARTIQTVDWHVISLTHKGEREINTNEGTLRLGTVYYARGIKFRLISIPELARSGVRTVLETQAAYIEKGGTRINLKRSGGLWTIPEVGRARVAALRMGFGGAADSKTWHNRMGHPSA
ncbi:MAG: hypothetical protein GY792_34470 [Gammaproteobacteria bacterium]|nr:hypothetical protein [Gammaproteobacteria bacterium]